MRKIIPIGLLLSAFLPGPQIWLASQAAAEPKVISDQTVTGFQHPESVACDPRGQALYVGQFGPELKPMEKDGKGRISKLSMTGKVLDDKFLPLAGELLNKPKGIWIAGNRLWVADIDVAWVFDLKTRKGRKLALPEAQFANDVAVMGGALYVSDNRTDRVYKVEPADFLNSKGEPKVTTVYTGKSVNPNGVYPAKDGSLLMVGFKSADEARGIFALGPKGDIKELSKAIGRLDGLYQMKDGTLVITEWNSGSVITWTAKGGTKTLASNFKGPADFCALPNAKGLLLAVPDLVKSEIRLIQLGK